MNSFKRLFEDFSWTIRTSFFQNSSLWVIFDRRFLTSPLLWRPPYIAYTNFLKFCPTPISCCLQPSPPLLFLMSCFFDWMDNRAIFNVLFPLMILWMYVEPWYLNTRTILVCVSHTYTQRYTSHSGTNRLTHPHEYILTSPAMCSQQLSVLNWIIHW